MTHLLILGSGRLSHFFQKYSPLASNIKVSVVPSRHLSVEFLLECIFNHTPTHIIDLLDPSTDDIADFPQIAERNLCFRSIIGQKISGDVLYFYLSSANLYSESSSLIYENSSLSPFFASGYLKLKFDSENVIKDLFFLPKIFRLPAIVFPPDASNPISFFDDLLLSRLTNSSLKPRKNDLHPLTYISAKDAVVCMYGNLTTDCPSVLNITSNVWSSRYHLKNKLSYRECELLGRRISTLYPHLSSKDPMVL